MRVFIILRVEEGAEGQLILVDHHVDNRPRRVLFEQLLVFVAVQFKKHERQAEHEHARDQENEEELDLTQRHSNQVDVERSPIEQAQPVEEFQAYAPCCTCCEHKLCVHSYEGQFILAIDDKN